MFFVFDKELNDKIIIFAEELTLMVFNIILE